MTCAYFIFFALDLGYEIIRSFITFHGVFMGVGYDIGVDSIWFVGHDL